MNTSMPNHKWLTECRETHKVKIHNVLEDIITIVLKGVIKESKQRALPVSMVVVVIKNYKLSMLKMQFWIIHMIHQTLLKT